MADDWRDVLFAEDWLDETDSGMGDAAPWAHATAGQLLALCKLLGVEQQSIANFLGVNKSAVSLWINRHRPTPGKYREALLAYTKAALRDALTMRAKEIRALPPMLQTPAAAEVFAMLRSWRVETVAGRAILTWLIKERGKELSALLAQESWTRQERQTLRALCQAMHAQLKTLEELETEHAEVGEQAGEQT